jgi:hypothetical protein
MMGAVRASETSVYLNETTRHIPESCNLQEDCLSLLLRSVLYLRIPLRLSVLLTSLPRPRDHKLTEAAHQPLHSL